jgi:hypothetical protein
MRVLTNLKDTVATDALIGRRKSRVISPGFVRSERALRNPDFLRMLYLCIGTLQCSYVYIRLSFSKKRV